MRNDAYWANRMRILEESLLKTGYDYVKNLEAQYDAAVKSIESQISVWYQRFAKNNDISLAEARKLLTTQELKEFKWTVEEYIKYGQQNAVSQAWMKQLENASARVHISRLDSLKIQLQQQAEVLHGSQSEALNSTLAELYERGYYHTAFEVQKGLGVGWSLHGLTDEAIKKVLSKPWTLDSQTFSGRIWSNKQTLVNTVNTQLTQMIMRGSAPDKAIKAIAERFSVSKSQAGRLVMTESAAFSNMARKDCFNDLGVEKFIVVETLDNETCSLCGQLDGKVFPMSEYAVGVTAPPFHPWCRGTTAPYFEDLEGLGDRYARDAGDSRYEVPKDMTYSEWYKKTVEPDKEYSLKVRMNKNYSYDRSLYERYEDLLGSSRMPKSVTAFQRMKYQQPDKWKQLQREYKTINKITNKPSYSDAYRKKMIDAYYDFRASGIEMTDHSLNRFLGQKARKTPFTKSDICDIMNKDINYLQETDGRMVRHYPPLSVITDANTEEVVSIVVDRKNPKSDWSEWTK